MGQATYKVAKYKAQSSKLKERRTKAFRLHPRKAMLTHIVIWKYRAEIDAEIREEHIRLLRHLPSVIKEIESLTVGFDVLRLPRSYDSGLVATFQDRAALEAYTIHPEHVIAANFGRTISEHVASVDFEN
jgi:hypothetical protein